MMTDVGCCDRVFKVGRLGGADGTLIPDCGHWIPEEQPHHLAESLIAFDRAVRARSTALDGHP